MLAGKRVLITGAGGISSAAAVMARAQGARVGVISKEEGEILELRRRMGGELVSAVADLVSERDVAAGVGKCLDELGDVDGLFNVVGISGRRFGDGAVHECTAEGWETTMRVNVESSFLVTRAVLPGMIERKSGSVVMTSSVLAVSPQAEFFSTHAYAASKGALISLMTSMAAYYAKHGVRVNALLPGLVRTPMSARAQGSAEIGALLKKKQPLLGDFLEASDVAGPACFFMSDWARGVTGVAMAVDGGWAVSG